MKLKEEDYSKHNFHNEKVYQWVLKHHVPSDSQESYGCYGSEYGGNQFGCDCETEWNDEKKAHIVESSDGSEVEYFSYYDKIPSEDMVEYVEKEFGSLSEEEKEEILDVENVRVYACPLCEVWSIDGDNC